jgi:hypothetical protein
MASGGTINESSKLSETSGTRRESYIHAVSVPFPVAFEAYQIEACYQVEAVPLYTYGRMMSAGIEDSGVNDSSAAV